MRRILLATVAIFVMSAPFAASADELTIREHPNGHVTVREHGALPPRDRGVIRERRMYDRAPPGAVITEHARPPRRDGLTIEER